MAFGGILHVEQLQQRFTCPTAVAFKFRPGQQCVVIIKSAPHQAKPYISKVPNGLADSEETGHRPHSSKRERVESNHSIISGPRNVDAHAQGSTVHWMHSKLLVCRTQVIRPAFEIGPAVSRAGSQSKSQHCGQKIDRVQTELFMQSHRQVEPAASAIVNDSYLGPLLDAPKYLPSVDPSLSRKSSPS